MSEKCSIPHIRTPRSLLDDPIWEALTPVQQYVFNIILKNVCYIPRKFDDHNHIIELQPAQICITIREIQSLCHKSISKNDIERSLVKLIIVGFLRQEVRHHKSIITISHLDTYDLIKKASEARSETTLRQHRDNIETERKKDKKDKNEINKKLAPNDSAIAASSKPAILKVDFSFEKRAFENISSEQIDGWKKAYPGLDVAQQLLLMQEWLLANREKAPKTQFQSFIVRWLTRGQNYLSQKPIQYKSDSRAVLGGKRLDEYDHAY